MRGGRAYLLRQAITGPAMRVPARRVVALGLLVGAGMLAAGFIAATTAVAVGQGPVRFTPATAFAFAPAPTTGYVVALTNTTADVVAKAGKRALVEAPPRVLVSRITLPRQRVDLAIAPIVAGPGKSDLRPELPRAPLQTPPLAQSTESPDTRPAIALLIDDLGMATGRSARALTLPDAVTLSFLPYGPVSQPLAAAAAAKGHEIFVHLPMQPQGDADPGPDALMAHDSDARLRDKLDTHMAALGSTVPIAGVNNHMGSRATASRRLMDAVMRGVAERGYIFVDSLTTPATTGRASALAHGVDFMARDVFLDHRQGADFILVQLAALERQAQRHGVALAIAHPHTETLDVLSIWVRGLERKGLRLVPVSEAVRLAGERRQMLAMAAR